MADLHKHKATSQQDARLPATQRENIDDEPEVESHQSDTAKDTNVVRGDDPAGRSPRGIEPTQD